MSSWVLDIESFLVCLLVLSMEGTGNDCKQVYSICRHFSFSIHLFVFNLRFIFFYLSDDFQHEIAAQILLVSIRQARLNEHLVPMSKVDQDAILKDCWSELFLLRASHWPIDVSAILKRSRSPKIEHLKDVGFSVNHNRKLEDAGDKSTEENMRRVIELCQRLQIDGVELSLLETLILCRRGK